MGLKEMALKIVEEKEKKELDERNKIRAEKINMGKEKVKKLPPIVMEKYLELFPMTNVKTVYPSDEELEKIGAEAHLPYIYIIIDGEIKLSFSEEGWFGSNFYFYGKNIRSPVDSMLKLGELLIEDEKIEKKRMNPSSVLNLAL